MLKTLPTLPDAKADHIPAVETAAKRERPVSGNELFSAYRDAAAACGQNVSGLTEKKLNAVIQKQEAALKKKLGCDKVNFRVVVQGGKVKLKASPVGA